MWPTLLQILLRPMAGLLAVVLGVKFAEGELDRVFGREEPPDPEDVKKRTATTIGLIAGIVAGGAIVGGLGGMKGRKK